MSTKPLVGIGAFDDFDGPVDLSGEGLLEFGAGITAVGEDLAQPGIGRADRRQGKRRAVGGRRHGLMTPIRWPCVSVTMCRLRLMIFLPESNPRGPPLSQVFAD